MRKRNGKDDVETMKDKKKWDDYERSAAFFKYFLRYFQSFFPLNHFYANPYYFGWTPLYYEPYKPEPEKYENGIHSQENECLERKKRKGGGENHKG
jgi:hypothetical protein